VIRRAVGCAALRRPTTAGFCGFFAARALRWPWGECHIYSLVESKPAAA
jgi:hypothetical protein